MNQNPKNVTNDNVKVENALSIQSVNFQLPETAHLALLKDILELPITYAGLPTAEKIIRNKKQ